MDFPQFDRKLRARSGSFFTACIILTCFLNTNLALAQTSFTVTNTADAGLGSLRQAIADANATAGTDTIKFNISGGPPHTIQPDSALPVITDPVVIDGYTQSGAAENTNLPASGSNAVLQIEIDGTNAGQWQPWFAPCGRKQHGTGTRDSSLFRSRDSH